MPPDFGHKYGDVWWHCSHDFNLLDVRKGLIGKLQFWFEPVTSGRKCLLVSQFWDISSLMSRFILKPLMIWWRHVVYSSTAHSPETFHLVTLIWDHMWLIARINLLFWFCLALDRDALISLFFPPLVLPVFQSASTTSSGSCYRSPNQHMKYSI